ncbi:unnamed protein product [Heterobilharzia americana]|nr:unnamed protein product [Heterobilharzia americana]
MECMLNYIGAFISLLSISFILLLCFCWNKKQSLIQKGSNSHHDVSVKSCQKTNHIDHKRFISRCKQLYRNDCNASVTVSNDFKPNHILIETSNLVTNESDLAYATTIELRENLNNRKIIPPGYQLLRQESNSHRNCELPPVPTYSNTNFTENKQTKSSNDESKNILEDTSDQLMYYSVQTVKRSIENDQHLYDIAIPVLRPNKSRTGTFELNNQFLYSLCDDQASDSDGLYASVSHPLSNNDEEALRNNMRRTSMNTKINSRLHNDINETNGSTQRRCEFCQSPYYSQLKDDSDVNSSDKNRTITTTSTAVVSTTDTIQFTELPTGISIDNDATTINNISCECHSSKQSTSYLLRKVDDFDKYSTNPPSYSFGHLYAQVTPRIKSRQTVNCPETASDSSVYSSNYTHQINVTGSTSLQSDGLLLTNSRCNDDTGGISSIHPLMTNCQLDSNYRYISVRESLANLRARNALPILYNIIKRDHNQPYHSFDDSDTNQESSDYERIYPVTSTESTILVNCMNTGLTSLSGGKQNTETSLCDKQLEHSYTELSGSNHDSGAYAQVYSTISTDSILTTTEPSNPFSHIVNSHPVVMVLLFPKIFLITIVVIIVIILLVTKVRLWRLQCQQVYPLLALTTLTWMQLFTMCQNYCPIHQIV